MRSVRLGRVTLFGLMFWTGLTERTIRAIAERTKRPHARTLAALRKVAAADGAAPPIRALAHRLLSAAEHARRMPRLRKERKSV